MKEKILAVLKSKLLFALVINLAIMVLCVIITSFVYDSSNDFYNSINIAKNHFYYSSSINYIAAVLIGTVQYVFSEINCFVAAQVFLSYISFTAITFVFCDKFNSRKAFTFTLVINLLFALNHYSTINSDRTAALGLKGTYTMGMTGVEVSEYDQTLALEDADLVIAKAYANGRANDDNCFVIFDPTKLERAYVAVKDVAETTAG